MVWNFKINCMSRANFSFMMYSQEKWTDFFPETHSIITSSMWTVTMYITEQVIPKVYPSSADLREWYSVPSIGLIQRLSNIPIDYWSYLPYVTTCTYWIYKCTSLVFIVLILIIMSTSITVWWVEMNITLDVELRISTSFTCFQFGWNSSDYSTTSTNGKCQNWIRNLPQIRSRRRNELSFFLPFRLWTFHQLFFWRPFVFLNPIQWVDIFGSLSFKYPFKLCQMTFLFL